MQFGDILTAIQARGYGPDTVAAQSIFVNGVYREVCGKQRWPFLEANDTTLSTTIGQGVYSLATLGGGNWRNLDAVRLNNGTGGIFLDLDYKQPQQLKSKEYESQLQGQPQFWTVIDQNLHIWPIPNLVFTIDIDYILEPADLVNMTDVPVIPQPYHDILVYGACIAMAERERDLWSVGNYTNQYTRRLTEFNEEYFIRQRQTSSTVIRKWDKYGQYGRLPFFPAGW